MGCIAVELDQDGYYIANADANKCNNCGICQTVCGKFVDKYPLAYHDPLKVYVGHINDIEVRRNSSSGGIATALVDTAIEQGYKVIGAAFDYTAGRVKHIVLEDKADAKKIRGSKYLPSFTCDAFAQIKANEKLLVIGTPCQIGGLRKYIGGKTGYENVLLVDFRCFGHPGYNLLDKYLRYLDSLHHQPIIEINLRDKMRGWLMWGVKAVFADKHVYYDTKYGDPFALAFRTGQSIHDVCLKCNEYKNHSHADIRLEDAWHFVSQCNEEERENGISQITIYSEKGARLFAAAADKVVYRKVHLDVHSRKWFVVEKKPDLLNLLRNDELDLQTVMKKFNSTRSIKERIIWDLKYAVTTNLRLFKISRKMFYWIKRFYK